MMLDLESVELTKQHEMMPELANVKMLLWLNVVTRLDMMRNEHIRGNIQVSMFGVKVREFRLKLY